MPACLLSNRSWEVGGNPATGKAHLLGEVLDDAVLRHLRANGKAALELLLYAAQHLLVLLAGEALHPCGHEKGGRWVGTPSAPSRRPEEMEASDPGKSGQSQAQKRLKLEEGE